MHFGDPPGDRQPQSGATRVARLRSRAGRVDAKEPLEDAWLRIPWYAGTVIHDVNVDPVPRPLHPDPHQAPRR